MRHKASADCIHIRGVHSRAGSQAAGQPPAQPAKQERRGDSHAMRKRLASSDGQPPLPPPTRPRFIRKTMALRADLPLTRVPIDAVLARPPPQDAIKLRAGEHLLADFATICLQRLTKSEQSALASFCTQRLRNEVTLGSFCAGTDAPVLVWETLAKCIRSELRVDFHAKHIFSSELKPKKRSFLMDMIQNQSYMFGDLCELRPGSQAHDWRSQKRVPVPKVSNTLGGYPCQDVSILNTNRAGAQNTIECGDKRTGSAFAGICQYLKDEEDDPHVFSTLENVVGLRAKTKSKKHVEVEEDSEDGVPRMTNLERAVARLREFGLWSMALETDPRLHGIPQSRGRLYQPVIPLRILAEVGITEQDIAQGIVDMYLVCCNFEMLSLHDFLLPESHPAIVDMLRRAESKSHMRSGGCGLGAAAGALGLCGFGRAPAAGKQRGSSSGWVEIHQKYFEEHGIDPSPAQSPADVLESWPGLHDLTEREFSILKALGVCNFPEQPGRCLNVSHTIGWHTLKMTAGCISPSMRLYLSSRCRLAHGLEALALQGIHYGESHSRLSRYESSFIFDLAGNAFQTSCCMASVLSTLVSLAKAWAKKVQGLAPKVVPAAPESDDDLDLVWGVRD